MKINNIITTAALLLSLLTTGCASPTPSAPVAINIWHVYGEQSDSPMEDLIEEFNRTAGSDNGVVVNTSNITSAMKISQELIRAQNNEPGSLQMPDLFSCNQATAAQIGADNLMDWSTCFTEDEQEQFVQDFLVDGRINGHLTVLPYARSAIVIMMNGTAFAAFSNDTGITKEDLATWDGFFCAAERYHEWSHGKLFCAIDYPTRALEHYALSAAGSQKIDDLFLTDGWYDADNAAIQEGCRKFSRAQASGTIAVSESYSSREIMTTKALCGLGSSAGILYYNDVVTDEDGNTQPMDLQVIPLPYVRDDNRIMMSGGVGLCARKTTPEKEKAISIFVHWLLDPARNLQFCAKTGYMPVIAESFDEISNYSFDQQSYQSLFEALSLMEESYHAVQVPSYPLITKRTTVFTEELQKLQNSISEETDPDIFSKEVFETLVSARDVSS